MTGMPGPRPSPRASIRLAIRPRPRARASYESLAVLDQSEAEFERTVAELEALPLFRRLRAEGLIRKAGLRGWIPSDHYQDYLDAEMLPLVRRFGLDATGAWIEDLASASPSEVERRAAEYGIPADFAQRLARYASHLAAPDGPWQVVEASERLQEGSPSPGTSGAQEYLAAFARRYGVDLDEFRRCILDDAVPLADACRVLAAPEKAVEAARRAALSVVLLDVAASPTPAAEASPSEYHPAVVASVVRGLAGLPVLAMDPESEYAQTYSMDRRAVDALYSLASSTAEADQLLRRMGDVNRRKTVLHRMLAELVRRQGRYLMSEDETDLAPLSQAELARHLGEHPSTVCRMVRDRWIGIHGQPHPVTHLLPSRTRVVAGLLKQMPEAPDRVIADALEARFGLTLSRRAIAYHRGKLGKRGDLTR